jgi:hypothetical protein
MISRNRQNERCVPAAAGNGQDGDNGMRARALRRRQQKGSSWWFLFKEYVLANDEISGESPGFRGLWCPTSRVFIGDKDPCKNIDYNTRSKRQDGYYRPDKPDNRGVDIKVFTKTGTDSAKDPFFF